MASYIKAQQKLAIKEIAIKQSLEISTLEQIIVILFPVKH